MNNPTYERKTASFSLVSVLLFSVPIIGSLCFLLFYYPFALLDSTIVNIARAVHLVLLALSWLLAMVLNPLEKQAGQVTSWLLSRLKNSTVFRWTKSFLFISLCVGGWAFLLPIYTAENPLSPYLTRIAPLTFWFACSSGILLHILKKLQKTESMAFCHPKDLLSHFYSFAFMIGLVGLVAWRIHARDPITGVTSTVQGIPGVPILTSQLVIVLLIIFFCTGFVGILHRTGFRHIDWMGFIQPDLILAGVVWISAFLLWDNVQLDKSYFIQEKRLPNFEFYPASDAALHDIHAQNLIIGEGLTRGTREIVRRPLYSFWLAIDHLIAGQDYDNIVRFQVGSLALLPAVLFLLTRRLSSREVGLLAAGLLISKERNAIALSGTIDVSHSKILMSDMPTALAVSLFTFLLVLYLDAPDRWKTMPLVLGGILGMTMLVRSQAVVLAVVPIGFLAFRAVHRLNWRGFYLSIGALSIGLVLTLLPWITRNYFLTGQFVLESTSQLRLITERFSLDGENDSDKRLPGETEAEYGARLVREAMSRLAARPTAVFEQMLNSYASNLYASFLTLPISSLHIDPKGFVLETGYWHKWDGRLQPNALLPTAIALSITGVGLGSLWKRERLSGVIPLFVFLIYNLSSAAIGSSGWRFILPVDWVVLVYFSAGLGSVFSYLSTEGFPFPNSERGSGRNRNSSRSTKPKHPRAEIWLPIFLFLLIGSLLPLSELVLRPRYGVYSPAETLDKLRGFETYNLLSANSRERFEHLILAEGKVSYWGRILYPLYIEAGTGVADFDWPSYEERSCNRISMLVIGPNFLHTILPQNNGNIEFPHAADTLIVGQKYGEVFQADAQLLLIKDKAIVRFSSQPGEYCSR